MHLATETSLRLSRLKFDLIQWIARFFLKKDNSYRYTCERQILKLLEENPGYFYDFVVEIHKNSNLTRNLHKLKEHMCHNENVKLCQY